MTSKPAVGIVILSIIVFILWGAQCAVQALQEDRVVYTCTACFKDKPTQCAVHDERRSEARGERNTRESARIGLCLRLDMGFEAEKTCYRRSPDDFNITCTSSIDKRWAINPGCFVH
jgi:hypothetical protein